MAHDKLQQFLLKQGSDPKKSARTFSIGLVTFLFSIALLYLGIDLHFSVQIIALVVMVVAITIAAKGYIGIVSNRIAFFRHQAFKNKQKYKNIK